MTPEGSIEARPTFSVEYAKLNPLYKFVSHLQMAQESLDNFVDQKQLGYDLYKRSEIDREALLLKTHGFLDIQYKLEDSNINPVDIRVHLPDAVKLSAYLIASSVAFTKNPTLLSTELMTEPHASELKRSENIVTMIDDHIKKELEIEIPTRSKLFNIIDQQNLVNMIGMLAPEGKYKLYRAIAAAVYNILSNDPPETNRDNNDYPDQPRGGGGGGGGPRRKPGDSGCGCGSFNWTPESEEEFRRLFDIPPEHESDTTPTRPQRTPEKEPVQAKIYAQTELA